jgi:hypothetical protein
MHKIFLAALATAAVLSSAAVDHGAAAMTFAAAARATAIEPVVNICGTHGCVPVQTRRIIHHQKPGNKAPHTI